MLAGRSTNETLVAPASSINQIVRVEEVSDAEFYAGDLFRRGFGGNPPDYPRHYVALYRPARSRLTVIGYVHYMTFEDMYLCGGLVIDEREYRKLPEPHRKLIKESGGIAEKLLRDTFARLAHAPAIWAYVGDRQSEKVCLRAGFRQFDHPHLMVVWNSDLSDGEKANRIKRAIAFGPF